MAPANAKSGRPSGAPVDEAKKSIEMGRKALLWDKNYDAAITYLSKAISLSPENYEAYSHRCDAYHEKQLYELSIADADMMIKLKPSENDGYIKKSCAFFGMGQPDEARAVLKSVLESEHLEDDEKSDIIRDTAEWLRDKGDAEAAIAILTDAIEELPEDEEIYEDRCETYIQEGDLDLALADAEKMISLDAEEAEGYSLKVRVLVDMGQADDAQIVLNNETPQLEGWQRAEVWSDAGQAIIEKTGDHEAAVEFFTEAIKCDADEDEYRVLRCKSNIEIGQYEAALEDAEKAAGSDADALSLRAKCLSILGREDEIEEEVPDSDDGDNDDDGDEDDEDEDDEDDLESDTSGYGAQAKAALKSNNYDEAIRLYTMALEFNDDPKYHLDRAIAYEHKGEWKKALDDLEECTSNGLSNDSTLILEGKCYMMQGHLGEAAEAFDQLEDKNLARKEQAAIYNMQADAEVKDHCYDDAIRLYTKAIELHKTDKYMLNRSIAHGLKEDWEASLKDVDDCINGNSSLKEAHFHKGKCLAMLGQFNKALTAYKKVRDKGERDKGKAFVYNAQGNSYLKDKRYNNAINHYKFAIELVDEPEYYLNRSIAYGDNLQWDLALTDAEKALMINPQIARAWRQKGDALQALGKPKEARAAYDEGSKYKDSTSADGVHSSAHGNNQSQSNSTLANIDFKNTTRSLVAVKIFENNNFEAAFLDFIVRPKTIVRYHLDVTKLWNSSLTRGRDDVNLVLPVAERNATVDVADHLN